jgi:ABC-2 type transport system ATP-binding protein
MILTSKLTKTYSRIEKEPGFKGSVKSLFNRKYKEKAAVDSFDLTVEPGEFVGLIGPNGAGKTTLVKMLTGIIAPTSGEISVLGHYPNKLENAFKMKYAVVMGQKSQLFFELTPMDTFRLFKELYAIPDDAYKRNVDYFIKLFEVSDYVNVQVRTLSLGERMKMELIAALLHNPGVLFLDEPTIGLDAAAQRQMRAFLREVNAQYKTTIILTSHYMEDVKSLCPRSVVINGGKKIYDGPTEQLFDAFQMKRKVTAQFAENTQFSVPENCEVIEITPHRAMYMVPREMSGHELARIAHEYHLNDLSVEEEDIGSVVERIYAAGIGGAAQ